MLAVLIVFGRRAQKSQYAQIDGQPGAAAAVLGQLKRGWKVDPGIAFNRQQDLVHRVVGPPGIVLVGEGNPTRLKSLLATERRKHERVASETPIFEVVSGTGAGAVPVPKLSRHVTKLGRNIKPAEMTDVLPAAAGPGRQPVQHADPQGPGADQHEGRPREHAGPLSRPLSRGRGPLARSDRAEPSDGRALGRSARPAEFGDASSVKYSGSARNATSRGVRTTRAAHPPIRCLPQDEPLT